MQAQANKQEVGAFKAFMLELDELRWDDHRYYHQNRINQSLHFVSSISFMVAYAMVFVNPGLAALIGWGIGMCSRQSGHFFFEPRGYDHVNKATHEHKEDIKVGYNLHRKRILHAVWIAIPIALYFDPTLFGSMTAYSNFEGFLYNMSIGWLVLGVAALLFRTVHLFFIRDVRTGLAWCTKIITDPFHDFKIYMKAPYYLMKGELMDPMDHALEREQNKQGLAH